ncbi:MAG: rod shape-determining protein MreD [Coriobacteriia bacterium]|nr:rod shape-determining protein MreD [Coriobacteriia bacterium]
MRRALPSMAAILAGTLLQVSIAPQIAIGGTVPNLLLLVTVTVALVEGSRAGAIGGFAAGLVFDLLGTGPVGAMAFVLALIGHLAGSLQEQMFAEGWRLPVSVVALASLLSEVAYWLVLWVNGAAPPFLATLSQVIVPSALYNGALALLVYPWLARLLRRERPVRTFSRLA